MIQNQILVDTTLKTHSIILSMFSKLRNYIQGRTNISDEDLSDIFLLCHVQDYKKDDVIIKRGEFCKVIGFLNRGIIRVSYIDSAAKEVTNQFIYEGCFFTYVEGLSEERKCHEDFAALEDCEVILMDKNTLQKILTKHEELNKLFTLELAQELKNVLLQNQRYRETSPTQRYLHFIEQNFDAYNRIPLKYIASYLGLEPQSLSIFGKTV